MSGGQRFAARGVGSWSQVLKIEQTVGPGGQAEMFVRSALTQTPSTSYFTCRSAPTFARVDAWKVADFTHIPEPRSRNDRSVTRACRALQYLS